MLLKGARSSARVCGVRVCVRTCVRACVRCSRASAIYSGFDGVTSTACGQKSKRPSVRPSDDVVRTARPRSGVIIIINNYLNMPPRESE